MTAPITHMVLDLETQAREDLQDTHWPQWAEKNGKTDSDAPLYAEFAQIAVAGCILLDESGEEVRAKGFACRDLKDEKAMLMELAPRLDSEPFRNGIVALIGHNIKGFDIPFMAKRYLAHRLQLPRALQMAGKKPWEIPHVDTMELLKFGGWANMSLESSALLLGLPSPKQDLCGAKVADALKEGRLDEVVQYCLDGDCRTTLEIYRTLLKLGA